MKTGIKVIIASAAAVTALSAAGTAYILLKPSRGRTAEIVQDGKVIYTIDLGKAEDSEYTVRDGSGGTNIVKVENGEIYVSYADCPDKTCMKMGKLTSESLPLVCLPHKLIIRLVPEE